MKISSKSDITGFLECLLLPYLKNKAGQQQRCAAHYPEEVGRFEELSRLTLGLTSYLYVNNDRKLLFDIVDNFMLYIDPLSPQYINIEKSNEYNQIFVEMFAPLFHLLLIHL